MGTKMVITVLPFALEAEVDLVGATIRETAEIVSKAEEKALAEREAAWAAAKAEKSGETPCPTYHLNNARIRLYYMRSASSLRLANSSVLSQTQGIKYREAEQLFSGQALSETLIRGQGRFDGRSYAGLIGLTTR